MDRRVPFGSIPAACVVDLSGDCRRARRGLGGAVAAATRADADGSLLPRPRARVAAVAAHEVCAVTGAVRRVPRSATVATDQVVAGVRVARCCLGPGVALLLPSDVWRLRS